MADLGRVSKRRDRCETKAGGESVKGQLLRLFNRNLVV